MCLLWFQVILCIRERDLEGLYRVLCGCEVIIVLQGVSSTYKDLQALCSTIIGLAGVKYLL